jgi:hypothetical protein
MRTSDQLIIIWALALLICNAALGSAMPCVLGP